LPQSVSLSRPLTTFDREEHKMDLQKYFDESCKDHSHLCPRQILGVRMGLAGIKALGLDVSPAKKSLLLIVETDGCFVDGVIAATGCTVGHRSLRVEDYGKTAVTFVNTKTSAAVRLSPREDLRVRATEYVPDEKRHYFAQMEAYKIMPDREMFVFLPVSLYQTVDEILSFPGKRVTCDRCGEEIMNEREISMDGKTLCIPCSNGGYCAAELEPIFNRSEVKLS